jgi:hypothetical protein
MWNTHGSKQLNADDNTDNNPSDDMLMMKKTDHYHSPKISLCMA